jgi:hypothetical protein
MKGPAKVSPGRPDLPELALQLATAARLPCPWRHPIVTPLEDMIRACC